MHGKTCRSIENLYLIHKVPIHDIRACLMQLELIKEDRYSKETSTFPLWYYCCSWLNMQGGNPHWGLHLRFLLKPMRIITWDSNAVISHIYKYIVNMELLAIISYLLWWGMTTERQERDHFLIGKLIWLSALNNSIQDQCTAMWFSAKQKVPHSDKEKCTTWPSVWLIYYVPPFICFSSRIPVVSAQKLVEKCGTSLYEHYNEQRMNITHFCMDTLVSVFV
jgi:hypothetical protein